MFRRWIAAVVLLIIFGVQLWAQDVNQFSSFYKDQKVVKAGELNFRIESLGFFQNNEYLGNFVDGYTLPGALIRPKITYSASDALYVELGGQFVKYSGLDKSQNVLPWFSARYRFSDRFTAIIGNLNQNNQHGLLEQLWEPERLFTDRPESGLQFLYSSYILNLQTWINWEQFIQKNDPFQEHFTAGMTSDLSLYQSERFNVDLPVSVLFYHKGGEIDSSDLQVQTHSNISAGLKLVKRFGNEKISTIQMGAYWLGYKAITEASNHYPYSEGHAYLFESALHRGYSHFSISYWNGFQFIAPKGRLLYQSVSDNDPWFTQARRSIVGAGYQWQKEIVKDAKVAFQSNAYLDIPTGDLSYSYGFYLFFNHDFLLSLSK